MKRPFIPLAILIVAVTLSACNFPTSKASQTIEPVDAINTSAAMTVEVLSTQLASKATTDVPPLSTSTIVSPGGDQFPTSTPVPSLTPFPTQTQAPTIEPVPCDKAEFVKDVTVPDGTVFGPDTSFTKTWRIKNSGSCTWSTSYKLVFDSGNAMDGPASANLLESVPPGDTIDLSVKLTSPETNGTYQGYWKLQNASGQKFGLGAGNKAFWVKIVVGTTEAAFAVTTVKMSVDEPNYSGACPVTLTFTAKIYTSSKGKVTYYWERSDGTKTNEQSLEFDDAGNKTVTLDWGLSASGDYWARIYINNPNHQSFSKQNVTVSCTP